MNWHFQYPELLLLLVPLLFLYGWKARTRGIGGAVRVVILVLLALIAAIPLLPLGGRGADVVVVADLSRSMPSESRARMLEIIKLIETRRGEGDRVGIVTVGREPRIERLAESQREAGSFTQDVDADGSDLGGAVGLALSLIPRDRPGRIVVCSDGEANGAPTLPAAYEAAARGVPVDFRFFGRGEAADLAVESLDLPASVEQREPFQFSAWVRADRTVGAEAVLRRDGTPIARQRQTFAPGATRLVFRDLVERSGIARYRLDLQVAGDRVPENNVGEAAVRVEAPAALLLVNATGAPDNLSRALEAGKLRVRIVEPSAMPADVAGLDEFRAVIIENVAANALGVHRLAMLTRFVNDLGGGLLLTGGKASFGVGGYFKSALDPYLPVSMELKNEHRKLSLAMVVALDRSGSMAAPAGGGRTKMDLANLGTCAAIETLGPYDEIGVIAVDSSPHVVQPLTLATDKEPIQTAVRKIQSMGGGIFVYTALASAGRMVSDSNKGTRHIVLFADAADAEEPGKYKELLATFEKMGVTVSVIGLGHESDSDAAFLKDVAQRGRGRIHFTASVEELPQLFAQEAITVARSSFISEQTACQALADMTLLGELPASKFPSLDGYNLTYLRPGASCGVVTADDYHAPVLAFWHRGLGRVAALTAEADGEFSASLNRWKDFGGFCTGAGRWLLGGEPPQGAMATVERAGAEGVVRVQLDPDRKRGGPEDVRGAAAMIVPPGGGASQRLSLAWVGEDCLEARFPLNKPGIHLGAVEIGGGKVLRLPPLSLPYSPEFEPRADPAEGRKTLAEIARVTGGVERLVWNDAFGNSGLRDRRVRDLVLPLVLVLLLLHVTEIAGRRLDLFGALTKWLRSLKLPALAYKWQRKQARPTVAVQREETKARSEAPAAASPLERAKAKARERLRG
ncbi:MAG: vWA domain-containing protein [Verrucomicrobiia bacterium]